MVIEIEVWVQDLDTLGSGSYLRLSRCQLRKGKKLRDMGGRSVTDSNVWLQGGKARFEGAREG